MNRELYDKLVNSASEMALADKWSDKAYKINMLILKMDSQNSAACTRLAKYFRLNGNMIEAKKMYSMALQINPNNQGAKNNLNEIEAYEHEMEFVDMLTTGRQAYDTARNLAQKGKYGLSTKCFLKAYSLEPVLKYAFTLARMYKRLGKHDDIEKLYNQLVKDNSSKKNTDAINAEFALLLQR